jgi:hypothetical protein
MVLHNNRTHIIIILSGVRLSPLVTAATTGLLYQPQMTDDGDCGANGGIKIDRGNRSTWRKPAPASLCPPQIPHDQTRVWTRATTVGSQRLTAWAMALPLMGLIRIGNIIMKGKVKPLRKVYWFGWSSSSTQDYWTIKSTREFLYENLVSSAKN